MQRISSHDVHFLLGNFFRLAIRLEVLILVPGSSSKSGVKKCLSCDTDFPVLVKLRYFLHTDFPVLGALVCLLFEPFPAHRAESVDNTNLLSAPMQLISNE